MAYKREMFAEHTARADKLEEAQKNMKKISKEYEDKYGEPIDWESVYQRIQRYEEVYLKILKGRIDEEYDDEKILKGRIDEEYYDDIEIDLSKHWLYIDAYFWWCTWEFFVEFDEDKDPSYYHEAICYALHNHSMDINLGYYRDAWPVGVGNSLEEIVLDI